MFSVPSRCHHTSWHFLPFPYKYSRLCPKGSVTKVGKVNWYEFNATEHHLGSNSQHSSLLPPFPSDLETPQESSCSSTTVLPSAIFGVWCPVELILSAICFPGFLRFDSPIRFFIVCCECYDCIFSNPIFMSSPGK